MRGVPNRWIYSKSRGAGLRRDKLYETHKNYVGLYRSYVSCKSHPFLAEPADQCHPGPPSSQTAYCLRLSAYF